MNRMKRLWLAAVFFLVFGCPQFAMANGLVNKARIMQIESSGNSNAYNLKSGARGLYQITSVVLQEYNDFNKTSYVLDDLFSPEINEMIAVWYIEVRIPQMLRYFKKEVTLRNVLICYNAGIGYVVHGWKLPNETVNYLKKYGVK